jgi:hypothetical protein
MMEQEMRMFGLRGRFGAGLLARDVITNVVSVFKETQMWL